MLCSCFTCSMIRWPGACPCFLPSELLALVGTRAACVGVVSDQAMTNQAEQAMTHTQADDHGPATPPSEKPHTSVTPPSLPQTSVTPPSLPRPRLPVRKPELEPAPAKPASPCRATPPTHVQHRIARSDTLQGLAVRYGVTPNAILAHNKLPNAQATAL